MGSSEDFKKFESGFNEGFFYAAQVVASHVLRLIDQHPSWMLEPSRRQAKVEIRLATKNILQKKGLIPSSYAVMTGKAEDVTVDFNLFI